MDTQLADRGPHPDLWGTKCRSPHSLEKKLIVCLCHVKGVNPFQIAVKTFFLACTKWSSFHLSYLDLCYNYLSTPVSTTFEVLTNATSAAVEIVFLPRPSLPFFFVRVGSGSPYNPLSVVVIDGNFRKTLLKFGQVLFFCGFHPH